LFQNQPGATASGSVFVLANATAVGSMNTGTGSDSDWTVLSFEIAWVDFFVIDQTSKPRSGNFARERAGLALYGAGKVWSERLRN